MPSPACAVPLTLRSPQTDRVPCGVLNEKTLTPLDLLGTQTDLAVQQVRF